MLSGVKENRPFVCFPSSPSLSPWWSLMVTPLMAWPLTLLLPALWLLVSSDWPLSVGMLQGIALPSEEPGGLPSVGSHRVGHD